MSESNRVDLSYIPELSAGLTPGVGDYRKIPFTAAPDFSFNPQTAQSEEIRSDRQTDDLALVGIEAGGGIDFELQPETYDDLLEGVFYNDFSRVQETDDPTPAAGKLSFSAVNKIPETLKQEALVLIVGHTEQAGLWKAGAVTATDVAFTGMTADGQKEDNYKVYVVGAEIVNAEFVETPADKKIEIDDQEATNILGAKTINKGDWIGVTQKGFYRITNKSSAGAKTTLLYDKKIAAPAASDWTGVTPAGKTRIFFSDNIHNGVQKKSFSILQRFQSLVGNNQAVFSGCFADRLSLSFETQAIVTGSLNFLAYTSKFLSVLVAAARVKEAPQNKILNSSSNIGKIFLGNDEVSGPNFIQSGSLEINNNSRRQNAVGSVGSIGVAGGTCDITGALSTYFGNTDLAQAVIENTEKSFLAQFSDGGGKRLFIDLPRIKFSAGSVGVPGRNEDLVLPLEYQALRHENLGYQAKFSAFKYA